MTHVVKSPVESNFDLTSAGTESCRVRHEGFLVTQWDSVQLLQDRKQRGNFLIPRKLQSAPNASNSVETFQFIHFTTAAAGSVDGHGTE